MKTAILVISLALNAWLLYRVLDLGVTITHGSDQIRFLNYQLADVEKLWTKQVEKMPEAALRESANELGLEVIDKKSESAVYLGRIKVVLSGDRVVKIVLRE